MDNNNFGQELAKQTLDQIPQANSNAKQIVGLVKEGGRITGYQLSDNSFVETQQAVDMAKQARSPVSALPTVEIRNISDLSLMEARITTSAASLLYLQKHK